MVLFKGLVQFVGSGVGSKDVFKRLVQSVGSKVGSPVDAWVDSLFWRKDLLNRRLIGSFKGLHRSFVHRWFVQKLVQGYVQGFVQGLVPELTIEPKL